MSALQSTFNDEWEEVNLEKYPTAKALVTRCSDFFKEVQNLYDPALTIGSVSKESQNSGS